MHHIQQLCEKRHREQDHGVPRGHHVTGGTALRVDGDRTASSDERMDVSENHRTGCKAGSQGSVHKGFCPEDIHEFVAVLLQLQ